jgi:hypothetical protein
LSPNTKIFTRNFGVGRKRDEIPAIRRGTALCAEEPA